MEKAFSPMKAYTASHTNTGQTKSNQNLSEADAMLRKPSSNLRYEETVLVL